MHSCFHTHSSTPSLPLSLSLSTERIPIGDAPPHRGWAADLYTVRVNGRHMDRLPHGALHKMSKHVERQEGEDWGGAAA